jgi:hypothetical protein
MSLHLIFVKPLSMEKDKWRRMTLRRFFRSAPSAAFLPGASDSEILRDYRYERSRR